MLGINEQLGKGVRTITWARCRFQQDDCQRLLGESRQRNSTSIAIQRTINIFYVPHTITEGNLSNALVYSLRFSNVLGIERLAYVEGQVLNDVSTWNLLGLKLEVFSSVLTVTSITNYSLSKRGEKEDFILFSGGFCLFPNVGLWCCRCCCYSLAFVPTVVEELSRDMRGILSATGMVSFLTSQNKLLTTRSIRRSRERAPSALIEWKYKSGCKRESSQSPAVVQPMMRYSGSFSDVRSADDTFVCAVSCWCSFIRRTVVQIIK